MQLFFTWKRSCCFIIANVISIYIFSQNTNAPYSVYGIGDIDNDSYNRTSGMGGTGLAIKSSVFLIDNNPAALTGLTRSFLIGSIAGTGKSFSFSGDPINATNSNSKDFWIKRFAVAVKINKFWGSEFGIGQFSNVNYNFSGSQFIEGTNDTYLANYQGDGGLNEYHWTNAVGLGKHFSFGLKSSFIAGSINQTEILNEANIQTSISTKQQDYITSFRFQGGALFETAVNKDWDLSIGAKYSPKTRLSADRALTVTENNIIVVNDRYIKSDRFYLPVTYAGGIALKHNKKTTFTADYTYEDWSSLGIKETGWQLINSNRVSAGAEFSNYKSDRGFLVERRFYQVGAYVNNSYLQIRNTPINEWGITAGMGGSVRNQFLYTLSLQGGVRGTTDQKLIKETYVGFTVTLSYRDILLSKGRKLD
ncbi:MAG: hypothetical protein ABUT20_24435 [Bacteroidota bacterium]